MIKKFTLILRKNVYPFEYMNDWEKINETPLPAGYAHAKKS